jgi:hypothetical protein
MRKKKKLIVEDSIPSEFKPDEHLSNIFAKNNLALGRIISESRGDYCKQHEGQIVIFNANIITRTHGKVWYGDLNISEDFDNLKNVADELKEDLHILMEGDARFGYENRAINILLSCAKVTINCAKCQKEKEKRAKLKSKK